LTAKRKEHVFLERPIRQIIPLDLMWDDPRLDLPTDAAEAVNWPLLTTETPSVEDESTHTQIEQKPLRKDLPPTFESVKTTTTARVDQDVAKLGKLIAEEIGPTTRGRRKLLELYEADEVERQIQQEAVHSAKLSQIIEEEKISDSE
jgi:hypothetical protein